MSRDGKADPPQPAELASWKEIAKYLGVSVRTAQTWEKERGLPVRRLPGPRGRVSVAISALEEWKAKAGQIPEIPPPARVTSRTRLVIAILAASVAAGAGLWLLFAIQKPEPATWRIEQNTLVVGDAKEREVWRKVFSTPLATWGHAPERQVWTGDLDGDGDREVLFACSPRQLDQASTLICYSHEGGEKWRFVPGGRVATRVERFEPRYRIIVFAVLQVGGRPRVLVSSTQFPYYPTQIAALSACGKLLGEYWHSGHLNHMAAGPNGLLYLGGVSNSYKAATLIVLDPAALSGASVEENQDYQLLEFEPARERARILFPRTCLSRKLEPWNVVSKLRVTTREITVGVTETSHPQVTSLIYHLTPSLQFRSVEVSNPFTIVHAQLRSEGTLDHDLSDREKEAWKQLRRPGEATSQGR